MGESSNKSNISNSISQNLSQNSNSRISQDNIQKDNEKSLGSKREIINKTKDSSIYKKKKDNSNEQLLLKKTKQSNNIGVNQNKTSDSALKNDENQECTCNNYLIVDDDYFVTKCVKEQQSLQVREGNYYVASDGEQALEIFLEQLSQSKCKNCCFFKMVIMDMNMPVMDGGNTCLQMTKIVNERLNQYDINRRMKIRIPFIVAQTAHTDTDTRNFAKYVGFNNIMNKPSTPILQKRVLSKYEQSKTSIKYNFK